ncbi:microcystin degradation protein MlrC [Mesorhizobium soli]|uniref:M81 family metallopeptidase n=1 Tax=Pseudaminobacter soli (ex Li et al. 2025) TaxID=1295366 RepID=UPI0024756033|nr:M81 family metallopeptidase [Mesorhizobium soli]MDH6233998.1 microcystin degradation protein MlrC [Mesorhizobium soli]
MRIVVARLNHETNTFSPVPTKLGSFDPKTGQQALAFAQGSNTALGAFYDYALRIGAELVLPLTATANPSGPVDDEAFEEMVAAILQAVDESCDAILLDLHGAMVTQRFDDGEGELLARIRRKTPEVPLGVALDLHGNVTQRMVENCDCIVGFKTYPHVDMYATGEHVTRIIDMMLQGGPRPHQSCVHPPMLAATLRMNTNVPCAMTDIVNLAREAEKGEGVYAVTVFGGFPIADTPDTGVSVVAVAKDAATSETLAIEVAAEAWRRREEFLYEQGPLETSLAAAREGSGLPGSGPVLLLDHGDNCMSGGTCDNMDVLQEMLAARFDGIVAGPICDPEIVATLIAAGVGATLTIELGNKVKAQGFVPPHAPLRLEGRVAAIGDGTYIVSGPIYTGQLCQMGRAVKFETDDAVILITELPHEPWDLGVFQCTAIDPLAARYLVLKSRMYCRPVFEPRCKVVVECASSGVTSSDYELFSFRKISRPIYPLDHDVHW